MKLRFDIIFFAYVATILADAPAELAVNPQQLVAYRPAKPVVQAMPPLTPQLQQQPATAANQLQLVPYKAPSHPLSTVAHHGPQEQLLDLERHIEAIKIELYQVRSLLHESPAPQPPYSKVLRELTDGVTNAFNALISVRTGHSGSSELTTQIRQANSKMVLATGKINRITLTYEEEANQEKALIASRNPQVLAQVRSELLAKLQALKEQRKALKQTFHQSGSISGIRRRIIKECGEVYRQMLAVHNAETDATQKTYEWNVTERLGRLIQHLEMLNYKSLIDEQKGNQIPVAAQSLIPYSRPNLPSSVAQPLQITAPPTVAVAQSPIQSSQVISSDTVAQPLQITAPPTAAVPLIMAPPQSLAVSTIVASPSVPSIEQMDQASALSLPTRPVIEPVARPLVTIPAPPPLPIENFVVSKYNAPVVNVPKSKKGDLKRQIRESKQRIQNLQRSIDEKLTAQGQLPTIPSLQYALALLELAYRKAKELHPELQNGCHAERLKTEMKRLKAGYKILRAHLEELKKTQDTMPPANNLHEAEIVVLEKEKQEQTETLHELQHQLTDARMAGFAEPKTATEAVKFIHRFKNYLKNLVMINSSPEERIKLEKIAQHIADASRELHRCHGTAEGIKDETEKSIVQEALVKRMAQVNQELATIRAQKDEAIQQKHADLVSKLILHRAQHNIIHDATLYDMIIKRIKESNSLYRQTAIDLAKKKFAKYAK
jgi:hypothetical protein